MADLFNCKETIRASNRRLSSVVRFAFPTDSLRLLILVSRTTRSPSADKALLTSFSDRRPSESSFSCIDSTSWAKPSSREINAIEVSLRNGSLVESSIEDRATFLNLERSLLLTISPPEYKCQQSKTL